MTIGYTPVLVTIGKEVGYSVRWEEMTEPGTTFLEYMTDDALPREVVSDPCLSRYSAIILDRIVRICVSVSPSPYVCTCLLPELVYN